MEMSFEKIQHSQKEPLLGELMKNAKEGMFKPEHTNALTGTALEELRDEEGFETELLSSERAIQKWVDQLSAYTQTLAKQSYEDALNQEDQFKEFDKPLEEIFWDEFKMNVRERIKQQLEHKEAA